MLDLAKYCASFGVGRYVRADKAERYPGSNEVRSQMRG